MSYQLLNRRIAAPAASNAAVDSKAATPQSLPIWALPAELHQLLDLELRAGNRIAYVTGPAPGLLVVLEKPFRARPQTLPRGVNRLPWWSGWWQSAYCVPQPLCILAAGGEP